MGRHLKEGLSYFPMDVDFFEDEKVQFISARFGLKGDAILSRLLCKIYRQGYSISFDDDAALLFARSVGDINSHGLVKDVVNECLKRDFFHEDIFKRFGMLTSKGIQKRYTKICTDARRKDWQIPENIDLLGGKCLFTHEEIQINSVESTQTKEKKSKEKESIRPKGLSASFEAEKSDDRELKRQYTELVGSLEGKDSSTVWIALREFITTHKPSFPEPYIDAWNIFALRYKLIEKPILLTSDRRQKLKTRLSEPEFDFFGILSAVKERPVMRGENDRGWKVDFNYLIRSEKTYTEILEGKFK